MQPFSDKRCRPLRSFFHCHLAEGANARIKRLRPKARAINSQTAKRTHRFQFRSGAGAAIPRIDLERDFRVIDQFTPDEKRRLREELEAADSVMRQSPRESLYGSQHT